MVRALKKLSFQLITKDKKMMTYKEFYDTLSAEELAAWAYEGVRIRDLYNEYLELSTPPNVQTYPLWALDAMGGS
jgi:hypothetical protein